MANLYPSRMRAACITTACAALVSVIAATTPARAQQPFQQPWFGAPEVFETTRSTSLLSAPDDAAPTIDRFGAGLGPIEATPLYSVDGARFARIALGEGDGWIVLRDLAPIDHPTIGETSLPAGLQCLGTEPFWSLVFDDQSGAVFEAPERIEPTRFGIEQSLAAQARGGQPAALFLSAAEIGEATAFIAASSCSDGMSDRTHPWLAGLILEDPGGRRLLEGCCWLPGPLAQ